VSYHGVELVVDELRPLGAETVAVSVVGETFVSSASEAAQGVALRLLASKVDPHRIGSDLCLKIASVAARAGDVGVFDAAVSQLVERSDVQALNTQLGWNDLLVSEQTRRKVIEVLQALAEREVDVRVCAGTAALWAFPDTQGLHSLTRRVGGECAVRIATQSLQELDQAPDLDAVRGQLQSAEQIFQSSAATSGQLLTDLVTELGVLESASAHGDNQGFEKSFAQLIKRADGLGLDSSKVSYAKLREEFIVAASKRRDYASALLMLPMLPMHKRTPAVHVAVIEALNGMEASDMEGVLHEAVTTILARYAEKDSELLTAMSGALRRGAESCLSQGKLACAGRLLAGVPTVEGRIPASFRPLVLQIVDAWIRDGELYQARNVAFTFLGKPGLLLKVKLKTAQLGLSLKQLMVLCALVLASVAGVISWLVRRTPSRAAATDPRTHGEEAVIEQERIVLNRNEPTPEYARDFVEALAFFDLKPGATLVEIKNAYRMRVKECHPDRRANASPYDNSEFVELTAAYDRVLQLFERHDLSRRSS
jgi:hypothetical protein